MNLISLGQKLQCSLAHGKQPLNSFHSSGVVFTFSDLLLANAIFEIQKLKIGYAFFSARLSIGIYIRYLWFQVNYQHLVILQTNTCPWNKYRIKTESCIWWVTNFLISQFNHLALAPETTTCYFKHQIQDLGILGKFKLA